MVKCPVCDAAMDVEEDELDEGESLTCEECGAELNVAGLEPLELEPAGDEDEEDEDDFEDLDEDEEEEEEEDEDEEDWK